jgi:inorganic triphosphatase YgiF
MTDAPTEIEAKFEIDDADRERLAALDGIDRFRVVDRRTQAQDDLYFDTSDGGLASAGSTLRVRRSPKGAFMTFKGKRASSGSDAELHIASRLEDEISLSMEYDRRVLPDAALPENVALSPLKRARTIVGAGDLLPTARLQNTRTVIDLADDAGTRMELSLDRCIATRLSDGRVVEFGEVELEAKDADRAALLGLATALQRAIPSLRPSHQTKLERALR